MAQPQQGDNSSNSSSSSGATLGEVRLGGRFRLHSKIASGSFGDCYLGSDITTRQELAIKLEPCKSQHPQLEYEYKIYRQLENGPGVPHVYWFGREGKYRALVMDLLGHSLEELMNAAGKFTTQTVCSLARQLLTRLEYIHSMGYVFRDVKPHNFLMGRKPKELHTVHVIDFGLAKEFVNPQTNRHISQSSGKRLTGTARYASINAHMGVEQSRRDDLEALGYMLVYFAKAKLPWQGLQALTKNRDDHYKRIADLKRSTSLAVLCKGLAPEFVDYLKYCRTLGFEEKPDYTYLRRLFRTIASREGFELDVFDWDRKTPGPGNLPAPVEISSSIALTPAPGLPTTVNVDLIHSHNNGGMSMVPSSASLRPSPSPMPQLSSPAGAYSTTTGGQMSIYESKEGMMTGGRMISSDQKELKLPMTPTNGMNGVVNSSPSAASLTPGSGNVGLPGYAELRSPQSSATLAIGAQRRSPLGVNDGSNNSSHMYQTQGRAIVASASSTLPRTPGTLPLSSPSGAGTVQQPNGSYQRASAAATAASSAAAALVGASTIMSTSGSSAMLPPPPATSHGSRPMSSHGMNGMNGNGINDSPMAMTTTAIAGTRPGTSNGRTSSTMMMSPQTTMNGNGNMSGGMASSSSTTLPPSASRRPAQQLVYDYDDEDADEESQTMTQGSLMYNNRSQTLASSQQRPQTRSGAQSRPTTSAGLQSFAMNGSNGMTSSSGTMLSAAVGNGSNSPRSASRASAAATPTPVAVPSSSHSKRRAQASPVAANGSSSNGNGGASTAQPSSGSSSGNNGSNSARSKNGERRSGELSSPSNGQRTMAIVGGGRNSMIATSTNSTPMIGLSQTARSGTSNGSERERSAVQSMLAPVVAGSARPAPRKRQGIHGLLGSSTPVTAANSSSNGSSSMTNNNNNNGSSSNGNGSNPSVPALLVARAMPSSSSASPLRPLTSSGTTGGSSTPSRGSINGTLMGTTR